MNIFEDTNPRELKELLRQIDQGESVLPDFQRDFVWDPNMTQELIVSIASNYPAGSLLRIRNTHNLFAHREFQGAPLIEAARPTYLVLDGQQRLTSLYQAFYGVGDHRYFLDLRRLLAGGDFEECIFHLRASLKRVKEYETGTAPGADLMLPLRILKGGAGEFSRWSRTVARRQASDQARIELEDALDGIGEAWIQAIDDYKFPVVTLSDTTGAEAVCTIFETLNRTGVKLSPFELLTARFWPKGINLRQLWSEARTTYPVIESYGIDPYYALQAVSLVARATPGCKRGEVLDLTPGQIKQWWGPSIRGLARGLELLRDDCGVLTPNWLPYHTIVPPLAAALAKAGNLPGPAAGAQRQKLARWFWCSVFGQTYENASNSQAAKDFTELLTWFHGGLAPESIASFRFDPRALRDITGRQRAVYSGVIALLMRRGLRDFHQAAKLTPELMADEGVDDHHIFPQGFLAKQGVADRTRDSVLNHTLIDRKTNIRISDRAPSDYMAEIQGELKADPFRELLDSHLIPSGLDSSIWRNDFEGFLVARQEAIWNDIKLVTGAREAADLVAETELEAAS